MGQVIVRWVRSYLGQMGMKWTKAHNSFWQLIWYLAPILRGEPGVNKMRNSEGGAGCE